MRPIGLDNPLNVKKCFDNLEELDKQATWRKIAITVTCVAFVTIAAAGMILSAIFLSPIALIPFVFVAALIGAFFEGPVTWLIDKIVTDLFKAAPKKCITDAEIGRNAAKYLETLKQNHATATQFFENCEIRRDVNLEQDLPLIACYQETTRKLREEIFPLCPPQHRSWYLLKKAVPLYLEAAELLRKLKDPTLPQKISTLSIYCPRPRYGFRDDMFVDTRHSDRLDFMNLETTEEGYLELGDEITDFYTLNQRKLGEYKLNLEDTYLHFLDRSQDPLRLSDIFAPNQGPEAGINMIYMRSYHTPLQA